jgi:hypothetical protein
VCSHDGGCLTCIGLCAPRGASTSWPADGTVWHRTSFKHQRKRLEFQVEQVDAFEWSLHCYIDVKAVPVEKGALFREFWLQALRDLSADPLRSIAAKGASAEGKRGARMSRGILQPSGPRKPPASSTTSCGNMSGRGVRGTATSLYPFAGGPKQG